MVATLISFNMNYCILFKYAKEIGSLQYFPKLSVGAILFLVNIFNGFVSFNNF